MPDDTESAFTAVSNVNDGAFWIPLTGSYMRLCVSCDSLIFLDKNQITAKNLRLPLFHVTPNIFYFSPKHSDQLPLRYRFDFRECG